MFRKLEITVILSILILGGVSLVHSITIHVPSEYTTIQAGVDAALDGDTVLVAPGTYTYAGNYNIDFLGKAIVVCSEAGPDCTTIDCREDGRGFLFMSGEDSTSVLVGFKITMAMTAPDDVGGGVLCYLSSPTIKDNIFNENYGWYGGGIGVYAGNPIIENNLITGNTAERGGGIACLGGSQATIRNNTIINNFSEGG